MQQQVFTSEGSIDFIAALNASSNNWFALSEPCFSFPEDFSNLLIVDFSLESLRKLTGSGGLLSEENREVGFSLFSVLDSVGLSLLTERSFE
jgi:hypothetical protein